MSKTTVVARAAGGRHSIRRLGEGFVGWVGAGLLVCLLLALAAGGIHDLIQSESARRGGYLGVELGAIPLAAIVGCLVSTRWPRSVSWVHDREWVPLLGGMVLMVLGVWLGLLWAGVVQDVIPVWLAVVGRISGGVLAASLAFAGAVSAPRVTAALAGVIAAAGLFALVELGTDSFFYAIALSDEGALGALWVLTLFAATVVLVLALLCGWVGLVAVALVGGWGAFSFVVAMMGYTILVH